MPAIAPQTIDLTGLQDWTTQAADAGGDTFANTGRTMLYIENTAGGSNPITVTIDSLDPSDYGTDVDITIATDFGEKFLVGPFRPARFNASDQTVSVTYSAVTNLVVAALELDPVGW